MFSLQIFSIFSLIIIDFHTSRVTCYKLPPCDFTVVFFFAQFCLFFFKYWIIFFSQSLTPSLPSLVASVADTSEQRIGRRMLDVLRIHIIHHGGSRVGGGSLVGRLTLLIVIPECSTLPIRVCFGQVCLSPVETYFLNYRTQTLRLSLPPWKRASLFCPTSPHLSDVCSCSPSAFSLLSLSLLSLSSLSLSRKIVLFT